MDLAGGGGRTGGNKLICIICYEDLNPTLDDLQSVSICGHVFHELCLQQWLEYCPAGKKPTCPVCKQCCSQKNVTRLYFQSTGAGAEPTQVSSPQKLSSVAEAKELREEVRKLEGKVSAISSAFEAQKDHLKKVNEELSDWKGRAKNAEEMKDQIKREKDLIQLSLQTKMEELSRMSSECVRVQQRSLALAKELAALKLITDLNLEEEDVGKLASVGNGTNHANTIDVLKKSLVLRNKSYKELMAQCNVLGRSETRSLKKLKKAEEKIKKLKTRLQELEKSLEEKENRTLRDLKASKRKKKNEIHLFDQNPSSPCISKCTSDMQFQPFIDENSNKIGCFKGKLFSEVDENGPEFQKGLASLSENKQNGRMNNLQTGSFFIDNEDDVETYPNLQAHSNYISEHKSPAKLDNDVAIQNSSMSKSRGSYYFKETRISEPRASGCSGADTVMVDDEDDQRDRLVEHHIGHAHVAAEGTETVVIDDDFENSPLPIRKGNQAHHSTTLFGGSLEPEGANKFSGKWSWRTKAKVSPAMHVSTASGSLIAVGADGRGGTIKVLRAQDQSLAQSLQPKRSKYGPKGSSGTRGCLQMEHYFGKTEG